MGYDPFSPVSLAQINVLCLPASQTPQKRFRECINILKANALASVAHRSGFDTENRTASARAKVLLNISDSYTNSTGPQLHSFESNREPQIAIGVVIGENDSSRPVQRTAEDVRSIVAAFSQRTASYKQVVTTSMIYFGSSLTEKIDGCLFISDLEDASAIANALSDIVSNFQRALPGFLEKSRNRFTDLSISNQVSRRLSISSNASNRTESASGTDSKLRETASQAHETAPREKILFGMLYLQAGQRAHALRLLTEGSNGTRSSEDHLWYARSLEGILTCMLLSIWARNEFVIPQVCFPSNEKHNQANYSATMNAVISANRTSSISLFGNTSTSSADSLTELLPHLLSTIFGLYERAVNSIDSTVPLVTLSEARVRWLSLLVAVSTYGCALTQDCVQQIVEGASIIKSRKPRTSGPLLVLHKTVLSTMLVDAALEAQAKLNLAQAAPIQLAIARSFSILGIERKQGFHLKQFLQRLVPALLEARRRGAAELGIHPSANLPSIEGSTGSDPSMPDQGIGMLLRFIADAYGLPTTNLNVTRVVVSPQVRLKSSLDFWYAAHTSGDLFMKLEILGVCIEISDAIPDPVSSLFFSSYLLQASKQTLTVTSQQAEKAPLIAPKDLPRLLQNIRNAAGAADQMGVHGCYAEYWDKFLVRDIVLFDESYASRLMPHTAHDLTIAANADSEVKKDPFIFNPFAKPKVQKGESIVTTGDIVYFNVVLQNPLEAEIEIDSIEILTEGSKFSSTDHSIVLGPHCAQSFVLSGIPQEVGALTVIGCKATIRGCYQEDYLILPADWRSPYNMKQKSQSKTHIPQQVIELPTPKTLSLRVIDQLPLLSVASTSLLQPSLMLLDGEATQIQIYVRNDSAIDIDFITLTFDDSVKQQLDEALGNKDLSPADTYEAQLQLIRKPAVKWLNDQADLRIEAHKSHTFDLEIFGKPGLTYINILIDYAFLGKPRSEITETFYTRQLSYTIATTVNGGVDIPRCMITPFQGDTAWTIQNSTRHSNLGSLQDGELTVNDGHGDRCMLLLDMRNVWPYPLEVDFWASTSTGTSAKGSDMDKVYTVSELLQPGQITRVVLLVPRIFIPDGRAVIPNLDTRRQFVVSASKLSIEAEAASREAFWYREQLLGCLKAKWREEFGSRTGEVDLRKGLRLTSRMIEALRIDTVDISFDLKPDLEAMPGDSEGETVIAYSRSRYGMVRNCFAILVTKVHNRGDTELMLLLRLQPYLRDQPHNVALELSKRFVWSGSLQQALHPPLQAGETREVELGIIVLAGGEYEVSGMVEEIKRAPLNSGEKVSNTGLGNERRIWHARQPCQIDVLCSLES